MLTNFDLEDLAHIYNLPIRAICMKDNLPKKVQDGNYIINLQSSEGGKNNGTHWTALVIRGNQALFFDSFGIWPSMEIREFVQRRPKSHMAFITKEIQDLRSSQCGLFCLGYLLTIHRGYPVEDFLSLFSSEDTKGNDKVIKRMFSGNSKGCCRQV